MNNVRDKKVLVVGLARSGLAAARLLLQNGAMVIATDIRTEENLVEEVRLLQQAGAGIYMNTEPDKFIPEADLVVISPGVPIDSVFIRLAREKGIEVISEIELSYRFCTAPIIAITGTNGKTTTTALTGEILRASGKNTFVVGNIGEPFSSHVEKISSDDIVVAEISSFQLEAIHFFRPTVCAILNITEDHLNRHKTMENYASVKARIFENSDSAQTIVLNADDDLVMGLRNLDNKNVFLFSRKKRLKKGAWLEGKEMVACIGDVKVSICNTDELLIPGEHNIENALAAILLSMLAGVETKHIRETLLSFRGVEHRIEPVATIKGITFYNDSKGTNPDATIRAIKAMSKPTVLIAGGIDKGSSFESLIDEFNGKIKGLVLLGETADKIKMAAISRGFINIVKAESMDIAVKTAFKMSENGFNVLLSPACASWDMFIDFEHRGRVFKDAVRNLQFDI